MEAFEGFNSTSQSSEGNGNHQAREEVPPNNVLDVTSSEEQDIHPDGASSSSRRGTYNRLTPDQIQELETCYTENPLPNMREKEAIGRKLNIDIGKVKFWFQNKRNKLKNQMKQHDHAVLKAENEKLRNDNMALQEELDRLRQLLGSSSSSSNSPLPQQMPSASDTEGRTNNLVESNDMPVQRNGYLELALSAMDELVKLGQANTLLWSRNREGGGETLCLNEYVRRFPPILGPKPLRFVSECSKATTMVSMSSLDIVEALLDANRWKDMFVGMIGSSTTTKVISSGTGGSRNGVLQLMKAEIQLISPLIPVRVVNFIRFSKQQSEGVWIVVDLSVDAGTDGHISRRLPSGCIIHDMKNGSSKVTWIEHTEYDESLVHNQYRWLISSGLGFGAPRWIWALSRHCECLKAISSSYANSNLPLSTRQSLKGLAQRMTSLFCDGVCLTGGQQRDLVADGLGQPRIMARKCISGLGEPKGIVMSASISVWIPTPHRRLFDLLLHKGLRRVWDVFHEIATSSFIHFPMGLDANCISVLKSDTSVDQNSMMLLQEAASDITGSLIVYAAVNYPTISMVMRGGDASSAALMPSGLYIVPGYSAPGGERGSMVTLGFLILEQRMTTTNLTVDMINTLNGTVSKTVLGIKDIVRSKQGG
ncbi:START domain, Homeodomain-like protein [Artemisia annua]|uniref:START domain, Homeodomain-like protein n=1 Tax=Artemisia annua TaxID=35608 RepID=A0A2U1Q7A7_ARTAN|nr:START domain, Homeodomain-like protein [Artemisia annua]